jgi:tRNA/rRNA methyltransferase
VKEHNRGVGAGFTEKRRPVELVWSQEFPDQKGATKREREIKGWRREKKEGLIRSQAAGTNPSPAKNAGSG